MDMDGAEIRLFVIQAMVAALIISRVVRIINSRKLDGIFRISRIELIVFFVCSAFMSGTYAFESQSRSVKIQMWISVGGFLAMAAYLAIRSLQDRRDAKRPPDSR